jgi:hypothetical protein
LSAEEIQCNCSIGVVPVRIEESAMSFRARALHVLLLGACLAGCAAPTAMSVINAAGAWDARVPDAATLEAELRARAFELGAVRVDRPADAPNGTLALRDDAYIRLLQQQLERAFDAARLGQGTRRPAYRVQVVIEVTKFTDGRFFLPDPSRFQVRMEVIRPDDTLVMRGRLRTGEVEAVPVPGGAMGIYTAGAALAAVSSTVPAMAGMITRVALGLQQGKSLDSIELWSWPAHFALQQNGLGLRRLQPAEIAPFVRSGEERW